MVGASGVEQNGADDVKTFSRDPEIQIQRFDGNTMKLSSYLFI